MLLLPAASSFVVWTEAAAVSADSSLNRATWTLAAGSLSRDVLVWFASVLCALSRQSKMPPTYTIRCSPRPLYTSSLRVYLAHPINYFNSACLTKVEHEKSDLLHLCWKRRACWQ